MQRTKRIAQNENSSGWFCGLYFCADYDGVADDLRKMVSDQSS
jgi:hypothetical protein